jgi:hypothetical protein
MTKQSSSLGDSARVDERYDAGLLRMLKTSPDFRSAKKRGRRKPTALNVSNEGPISDAAEGRRDTK